VFDYGPTFGRSYAVFYNQVRLGGLEVKPSFRQPMDPVRVPSPRPPLPRGGSGRLHGAYTMRAF
jgi:hypothetical protein